IPRWPFDVYDDENPAGIDTTLWDSPRRVARPQAASFCTLFTARRRWGGVQPARFWRPTNSADSPLLHRIRGRKCEVRANLRTSREPDELRARQTDAARETEAANQTDATRQRL
ncbi:hypothetical protein, partial [Microbacterium schleiferi]|uniref:hypothetical protein n=1 Tax=Microbacterium schleiferi TaxID=69362 RepID=UPI001D17D3ED